MKKLVLTGVLAALVAAGLLVKVGGGDASGSTTSSQVTPMDLSSFSEAPLSERTRLLFIHHSCGGALLADEGANESAGAREIWKSHTNGGGLRRRLEAAGYEVHEASYGSDVGEATDMFDWLPKFRTKMEKILKVAKNDELYPDERRNQIVVFKSCFPNNEFVDQGTAPGNPAGPELTVWNAKATLLAVRDELAKHPDVLFVYLTSPPVAPRVEAQPAWKWALKKALGKPDAKATLARQGALAREFTTWAVSADGWLKGYPHRNLVVFDMYGVLTDQGASNLSRYATEDGFDSHPSSRGNQQVAAALVPFLNRAARRAGLAQ